MENIKCNWEEERAIVSERGDQHKRVRKKEMKLKERKKRLKQKGDYHLNMMPTKGKENLNFERHDRFHLLQTKLKSGPWMFKTTTNYPIYFHFCVDFFGAQNLQTMLIEQYEYDVKSLFINAYFLNPFPLCQRKLKYEVKNNTREEKRWSRRWRLIGYRLIYWPIFLLW